MSSIPAVKKKLAENIVSLTLVQGTNLLLPLITLPYLVRVLGPDKYGLIAFAQAFNQYFISVTDYGFMHTAPRRVSVNRDDKEKLRDIFNAVMFVKLALMLACFVVAALVVFSFARFRGDWELYGVSFLMVLGNVLFPVWLFQGLEKMKYITVLNLVSKLFFTGSIFLVIKDADDYLYVPLLNSMGLIFTGIISIVLIARQLKVSIGLPPRQQILEELKEGWHVFIGMFAVNLFSSSNVFILGLFANNTIVGYFKAGDTLIRAVSGILQPVNNAMYPHICRLAVDSKEQAYALINKLLMYVGTTTFAISILINIFAYEIVNIAFGSQFHESGTVIRILSFFPFINGISGVLAVQGLLAFNKNKVFSSVISGAAFINITLAFILAPLFMHVGISMSLLSTEILITIIVAYITRDIWQISNRERTIS